MQMLSDDDLDLSDLSGDELALAWDLWFDLAQATNDADPPYTHGVFRTVRVGSAGPTPPACDDDEDAGRAFDTETGQKTCRGTIAERHVGLDGSLDGPISDDTDE